MKNINTKKVIAGALALTAGAAFLGAAVAAQVGTEAFTSVTKGDVIGTNGMPTATVIVGSNARPIDVVWAGNIAAAIGSQAYTTTTHTVEIEGTPATEGSTTISGDGKLFDKEGLNSASAIVLKNTDASFLNNESMDVDNVTSFGGNKFSSSKLTVKDQINITGAKFGFNKDKDVADLVASFPNNSMIYSMTFSGDGVPVGYKDADSDERVKINFMGKKYIIENVDASSIKLLLDKSDLSLSAGDTFEPQAGYIVEVVEILQSSVDAGVKYEVELRLKNSEGTVIKTAVFKDGQDVFKNELDAVVKINTVYNSRVTITTGAASSITLKDGREIEDFPNKDDEMWDVELTYNGADTHLQKIEVKNNLDYEFIDEDSLKVGEEIDLFGGLAKANFLGLSDETMYELKIENNQISYVDKLDNELDLFLYEKRTSDNLTKYTTKGTIDGRKLYFEFDATANTFTVKWDDKDGDAIDDDTYVSETFVDITIPSYENPAISYTYGVYVKENGAGTQIVDFGIGIIDGQIITDMAGIGTTLTFSGYDITPASGDYADTTAGYFGSKAADNSTLVSAQYEAYGEFTIANTVGSEIKVYVDAWTGKLIDTESTNFKDLSYQVTSNAGVLGIRNSDDLKWAMTDKGSKYSISSGRFTLEVPEKDLTARVFVGSDATTTTGGSEGTEGSTQEYTTTTPADIDVANLVKLDTASVMGTKIVVGGHAVNTLAAGVTNDFLTQDGQWVMGKTADSKIVVAGFSADGVDTASAARALIDIIMG